MAAHDGAKACRRHDKAESDKREHSNAWLHLARFFKAIAGARPRSGARFQSVLHLLDAAGKRAEVLPGSLFDEQAADVAGGVPCPFGFVRLIAAQKVKDGAAFAQIAV